MLTPHDEHLCHQLSTTFDHVGTSDPRWTERVVLYAWDVRTGGAVNLMSGLARYANRNVVDAYGMVTLDTRWAHVVRASRELRPERDAACVGPFSYEVISPLERVRSRLSENPHGLMFDVELVGTFPPYEQAPAFFRSRGRVQEDARRYYQVGRASGWITVDGKRIQVEPEHWRVGRDHSWGVRRGGGGGGWPEPLAQPEEVPPGVLYFMCIFDFGDWMLHVAVREDDGGRPWHFEGWLTERVDSSQVKETPLTGVSHDLKFRPEARLVESGRIVVHAANGSERAIDLRATSRFLPGLAGYDRFREYASGMWKGPFWMDGFAADITDPAVYRQVSMLSETLCEVRTADGALGHGLLEMVCVGKYPRYGYQGY